MVMYREWAGARSAARSKWGFFVRGEVATGKLGGNHPGRSDGSRTHRASSSIRNERFLGVAGGRKQKEHRFYAPHTACSTGEEKIGHMPPVHLCSRLAIGLDPAPYHLNSSAISDPNSDNIFTILYDQNAQTHLSS